MINLKNKQVRTVLDGKYNYSYADGDQYYQWSPDSKWFLAKYIAIGGWNNTDIIIRKTKNSSFKNEKSKKEVDVAITVSNKDIV